MKKIICLILLCCGGKLLAMDGAKIETSLEEMNALFDAARLGDLPQVKRCVEQYGFIDNIALHMVINGFLGRTSQLVGITMGFSNIY